MQESNLLGFMVVFTSTVRHQNNLFKAKMLASFAADVTSESFVVWQENWGAIPLMLLHNISSFLQLPVVLCRAGGLEISVITSADGVTQKRKRGGSSPSPSAPCDTLSLHTLSERETQHDGLLEVCIDQLGAVLGVVCGKSEGSTSAKLLLLRRAHQYHHQKGNPSHTLLVLN